MDFFFSVGAEHDKYTDVNCRNCKKYKQLNLGQFFVSYFLFVQLLFT